MISLYNPKPSLTRYRFLPPISAAEARHSTGDDHHETDADSAHYQEELQVDLAVLASKPSIAVAGNLRAVEDTLAVPVAELTLRAGTGADPARQEAGRGDVQVAGHTAAVVGTLRVGADSLVGAVVVLGTRTLVEVINCNSRDHHIRSKRKLGVLDTLLDRGADFFLFFLSNNILVRHLNKKFYLHVLVGFPVSILNVGVQFEVSLGIVVDFYGRDLRVVIEILNILSS